MNLLTLLYFVLILGITVFIHELGHFIFAKRAGIYVYEFAIGMGPRIFKFKRKNDETEYSIRLFPIGGFVSMAGESVEVDENIPENRRLQNKTWSQKFLTIIAGVVFNFILAIIIFFIIGLTNGVPSNETYISTLDTTLPASKVLTIGDEITSINGKKVYSSDHLMLELQVATGKNIKMQVKHKDGSKDTYTLNAVKTEEQGEEVYKYGFGITTNITHNFLDAVMYGFTKTIALIHQMFLIIWYLITGALSLSSLAGPIGIYSVVGEAAKSGLINLVYLTGLICVNVGVINILPIPAFDGGRILFLIIEKIKGKPIDSKVENIIHSIGFALLMLLVIVVTFNDILRLF